MGNVVSLQQARMKHEQPNEEAIDSGYIKLYRGIQDVAFKRDPDRFALWVHMLLEATHKPYKTILGNKTVQLLPGQFISGVRDLAADTGSTERKVRTSISYFEREGMILRDTSNRNGTVFTIVKYESYQAKNTPKNDTPPTRLNDTQSDTLEATNSKGCSESATHQTTHECHQEATPIQENNLSELPKGNSCPEEIPDESSKVTKVRPDAAVQTPEGRKWGTQADLDIARCLADDVARILGGEKDRRSDQELCEWANEIRLFRTRPRDSGQHVTHEHMLKIWSFAHENPFWNKNLQSPHKLRHHWGKLVLDYKQAKQSLAGDSTHATGQSRTEYQRQRAEVDAAINNWQDTSWADDFINNGEI